MRSWADKQGRDEHHTLCFRFPTPTEMDLLDKMELLAGRVSALHMLCCTGLTIQMSQLLSYRPDVPRCYMLAY